MGTFNAGAFRDKLGSLNSTQASIETLSNWCQFFRKQAPAMVAAWDAEYVKAQPPRRLLMLYLANDILQNSRRKGPNYVVEFYKVIPRSLRHSLKHFDEATRNRVNRLIGVWDDRKVFGSTGTRTLKELLAEAETPTKRGGPSARTGGPAAADGGPFGGPPTPNGAEGGSGGGVPRELRPLAAAMGSVTEAADASRVLVERCSAVLQRGLLETGTAGEVQQAADLLREYQGTLAHESQALEAALGALRSLIAKQEEACQRVRDQEALAARQLGACTGRLAELASAPQPAAAAAATPPPVGVNAAEGAAEGAPPPLPAAAAPPLPAMSGPGGAIPPPLPVTSGVAAAPQQPALPLQKGPSLGDAAAGAAWLQSTGQQRQQQGGTGPQPPLPDDDMEVEPASQPQQQPMPGPSFEPQPAEQFGGGGEGDDEAAAAAAALVAQLSAANDSKALLEALAALPQDQQREISLSFLNSGSVGGLAPAGGAGGGNIDEEEYNPEDPGF